MTQFEITFQDTRRYYAAVRGESEKKSTTIHERRQVSDGGQKLAVSVNLENIFALR